jgi:hypothetical protein
MRIEEALLNTVLIDDDNRKLKVRGASDDRAMVAAVDAHGQLELIDYSDIEGSDYLAFVDEAAADAYLAKDAEKAEAA